MLIDIGGTEVINPRAVVLKLDGVEVGRRTYDGGLPAIWTAVTFSFDEVIFETDNGDRAFEVPGGLPVHGTGGDIDIPSTADPNDPWVSTIPLVPKTS